MLSTVEAIIRGASILTVKGRRSEPKKQELPKFIKGRLPLAEEVFIAVRNSIFPQNLSIKKAVYHISNGFFFKIHPVELNPNGTRTYVVERKKNPDDAMPIDLIEVTRNPNDQNDSTLTNSSYRRIVIEHGASSFVNLQGDEALPEIEGFLTAMTPSLETGSNPASL